MNPFERRNYRQVLLHQHTEQLLLGHIDTEYNPLAHRLGADLLPIDLLEILGAVSMLFDGDTSNLTVQA